MYVLALQSEDGKPRRYVGSSANVERRMAEHLGVKSGGAAWCRKYKPVDVLSVKCVETPEEAAAMEVMLCSLHMAEVGVQCCRGGRWNMSGDMKRRPPYFDDCEFQSPRSDEAAPPTPEEVPKQIKLPDMLPANYEVLRDENGIVETDPPKSCPIFRDHLPSCVPSI